MREEGFVVARDLAEAEVTDEQLKELGEWCGVCHKPLHCPDRPFENAGSKCVAKSVEDAWGIDN